MASGEQREHLVKNHGIDAAGLLRAQITEIHRALDECFTDWLRELAPQAPPTGSLAVSLYLHAATVEDVTIHSLLRRVPPVYETGWAGKGPARYSTSHLEPLLAYAHDVFHATDAYLAGLPPQAVSQTIDLSRLGQGTPTIAWVVSKFIVLQLGQICGELMSVTQRR